ncbi:hypothetical protein ACFW2V_12195 [Streptomyces sp. NPDC058947]|uniref:hypothetical protein n=1 Tax=Streptomyces sp. NPDC058947 TaxID=3346675 RepID=UPI00367B25AC
MGERLDRIRRAFSPPVTAEWVDAVVTQRSEQADEIEKSRGSKAAQKHRRETGKMVEKMMRRGVI